MSDDVLEIARQAMSMTEVEDRYPLIQTMLYDTPLMITPSKADVLHNVLQGYANGNPPVVDAASFRRNDGSRPYQVTTGGVAVIPVYGTLAHRAGMLDAMSGLTSYRQLHARLRQAEQDPDVKGILLDIDSPGGAVSGLYELTDHIKSVDEVKPIWSLANDDMFSAAYAIAASTRRIHATITGMAGSIGVLMMHMDQSKADEKAGRKYIPIFAGSHKVDWSSHAPLKDETFKTGQRWVSQSYDLFVAHVLAGRPEMTEESIRGTEAQIFTAGDAFDLKLIDAIASYDDTLNALEEDLKRTSAFSTRASARSNMETSMSTENKSGDSPAITQADLDADVAKAKAEGKEEGLQAGIEQGVKQEHDRVNGILALDSAKGKIDATLSAAIENGLDAEAAGKFLAAVPASKKGTGFEDYMNNLGNPEVNASGGEGEELTDDQLAARAVSLVQA
jgi:signal peptide peptidase SppA